MSLTCCFRMELGKVRPDTATPRTSGDRETLKQEETARG